MAIHYLPSLDVNGNYTYYPTNNSYVVWRIVVTEIYTTTEKKINLELIAKKNGGNQRTNGSGSVTWYVDGINKGTTSWANDEKPLETNGTEVSMSSLDVALDKSVKSPLIEASFVMSGTSVGTNRNGGNVSLSDLCYTLTINPNGGIFPDGTTEPKALEPLLIYNTSNWFNISGTIPTRVGYTLDGFYDNNGELVYTADGICCTGSYWNEKDFYIQQSDLTVEAHWTANEYKLNINFNGGIYNEDTNPIVASQNLVFNENYLSDISDYLPTRELHEFNGFYDSDGVKVYDETGKCVEGKYWSPDNTYQYDGELTIYAKWQPLNIAYEKLNGKWFLCRTYVKVIDTWKPATMNVIINGSLDNQIYLADKDGILLKDKDGNYLLPKKLW